MTLRQFSHWCEIMDEQERSNLLDQASASRVAQHGNKNQWGKFAKQLTRKPQG